MFLSVQGLFILNQHNRGELSYLHSCVSYTCDFCPKRAHKYLVSKGKSSSNLMQFKNQLQLIWFHLYHRQRNAGWDTETSSQTRADDHVLQPVGAKKAIKYLIFCCISKLKHSSAWTLVGLSMSLLERQNLEQKLLVFTTGSSSTCKKKTCTWTTKDIKPGTMT